MKFENDDGILLNLRFFHRFSRLLSVAARYQVPNQQA